MIDEAKFISAGKFRRYHGEGLKQLLDVKTLFFNIRDLFRFMAGVFQSYFLLARLAPDAIFIKGGFVGVPVGLAAAWRKIPYITHDSDAIPGLANQIIARWAKYHAVALSASEYKNYPPENTIMTGIPVAADFYLAGASDQEEAKNELGLSHFKQLVLVTGGGLGAQRLNEAVVALAPKLLEEFPQLALVHLTGESQEQTVNASYQKGLSPDDLSKIRTIGFSSELAKYALISDVIITRAGATTIAEFAILGKPCIVVPNPNLAGGHQLKNAKVLEKNDAALMVTEGESIVDDLLKALRSLLSDAQERRKLASNLAKLAQPDAASRLAKLLISVADKSDIAKNIGSDINNKKDNY